MNTRFKSKCTRGSLTVVAVAAVAAIAMGTASAEERLMTLHSANFLDGGTLPLSMINNMPNANGMNACTASGAPGGNKSPQLSWKFAPAETQSFVVIIYDVVAQFTQWAIYNIPAETTSLPENAGVPGSSFGVQNGNDFFSPSYGGPCPPTAFHPFVHEYAITVYALDEFLPIVKTFGAFVPAGPEGLYQELIEASRQQHVLASATIKGFYSAVASANN